ncbi:glutamate--tRNA ligase [Methylobacterium radiotolerans]|uniref:Glutamate--tRNA ligase 2 n=1 Tax=Methylobacterium radiotolerans (strain ATCC 27329 / DSM 1819 / JCM 2831 / NBRC 15690 / NCIMB 10815 / 0-1) TaxID=426355 RepID=SYE2_METRJ|nr:glutamate--tRNA ligase [Methylobacterium radiotolerans]B1M0I6.1 RecName: Full=Glutamate--tRNA ligase 2; AltName: Full=Glutamyl-tRNA synthetase 2; Short=GluRS 2 [Methylobacterium radiotolerans JCM 2831]ACB27508.1 glutamyl-tRNA synthetase [Methylobacterium radiotolerans JCM 2831]GEM99073.1 glutamate--tRNA ligase [Methylobacterium radiotolerans]
MTLVRFAPSPTGYLHIGNARPALLNALFARRTGGRFLLRLDDTDAERSTEAFAEAIGEDLAWLGIVPDLFARQSARTAQHDAAADRLRAAGRLYPCYETPEELERRRRRQLGRGQPPIYDRAALRLTGDERAALEAEGRRPHWRFLLEARTVGWDDLVRGPAHVDCASLSDPVLIRADGSYLYTLPSVVDDADLGITHVIRGEDHVTNTGVQVQIFEALGAAVPVFGHHNLLTTADGEGLSKRLGHLSLRGLREAGYEPAAVRSLAVLTGSAESVRAVPDLDTLAGLVDLGEISRAPARFDPAELDGLNARLIHAMPYREAAARLADLGIPADRAEAFWLAVRANLSRVPEAAPWWRVVTGPVEPVLTEPAVIAAAVESLPPEPFGPETWNAWTTEIRTRTGAKGRGLFMPLRLALTGLEHGPDLAGLLPLIGRERAARRLSGAAA